MSKFNTKIKKGSTKTQNLVGGEAYKQSKKLELVSILLTSFVQDSFYQKTTDTLGRLKSILGDVEPEFAAKAAIFARDKFGMRSISHALAGELTSYLSGHECSKSFYDKVVVRPDDMMEILSYYTTNRTDSKKPKFPNSLKKGFAKAFDKFDNYQIAKWKSDSKSFKLIDVVNLVHPVPTDRNKESLNELVNGVLKNTQTWESMLSKAGQEANSGDELTQLKNDAWKELIENRKIGYFALLRNLRNIIQQSTDSIDSACDMLVDEKFIKSSRILPFRFKTAYDEILKLGSSKETRKVLQALDVALNKSVSNVPKFDGETLVVIDTSGSMAGKPSEIASLFGAMIAKVNNCDVMTFDNYARYVNYNPSDTLITIKNGFVFSGGGTNFKSIFETANKGYENIIILSDMQGWVGYYSPVREFNKYKDKFGVNPHVFSWDLAGLSTLQLPQSQVYCLAGFSDKVFDIMELLKTDKNALVNEIESLVI
jgi:60 kDa SS-A/Ro ribonucleoprotein